MQLLSARHTSSGMIALVNEGTPVFDRDGRRIGSVKHVNLGDTVDELDEFLARVPESMQAHVAHNGFIQIDCGLLWPERCATSDQVDVIDSEGVWLNVDQSEVLIV